MKNYSILLILIILVSNLNIAFSLDNKIYSFENRSKDDNYKDYNFDCNLYLLKSHNYVIHLHEAYYDVDLTTIISEGTYHYENKYLILNDNYNGYELKFTYNENLIIPLVFFKFAINKPFAIQEYNNWNEFFEDRDTLNKIFLNNVKAQFNNHNRFKWNELIKNKDSLNRIFQNKYKEQFNNANKVDNELIIGLYGDHNYGLLIKEDNSYELKFRREIFSQGSWKRNKNDLACYDSTLKHTFNFFIGKNEIVCTFFPDVPNTLEINLDSIR